nr:ATP-binding protein [Corynebacterium mendelii]
MGANHDLFTGIDELIDNSIDAHATKIAVVFYLSDMRMVQIAIHDDGDGMSKETLEKVLRLGSHEARSSTNIGRYGMGMKEGSYANAGLTTIVSRVRGHYGHGYRLNKQTLEAEILSEKSVNRVWNLRDSVIGPNRGTTIVWNQLVRTYQGNKIDEARAFVSSTLERLRKHIGIRYHRFLESDRLDVSFHNVVDEFVPGLAAGPKAISPFAYRRSGDPDYPRTLTLDGKKDGPAVTAHIWPNRSRTDNFNLEAKDELGHQGFYIYDANRLITHGGWHGYRQAAKDTKLLRLEISSPELLDSTYMTISPQKGSVRLTPEFHDLVDRLKDPSDPSVTFATVVADAREALRASNSRSADADPIPDVTKDFPTAPKEVIWETEKFIPGGQVKIEWGTVEDGGFVAVDPEAHTITVNDSWREALAHTTATGSAASNPGDEAPLLKTLLYLAFGQIAVSTRMSAKAKANLELQMSILNAAADVDPLLNDAS